jgi:hypothetical protein
MTEMTEEKTIRLCETKLNAAQGGREIVATISTTSVDRDGDVVLPSGADLRNFWKIPTVLMSHDHTTIPVGRVPKGGIRTTPNALIAKAEMLERPKTLPANVEWQPDTLLDLFKQGAPLGFSIGFRVKPDGFRYATDKDQKAFGDDAKRVITAWELLEFSVVAIPANQDAVAMAVSKCAVTPGSWTRGALGLSSSSVVRIIPATPKRLRMEIGIMPVRRLSID